MRHRDTDSQSFRALDADKIISTACTLEARIDERFPRSGLRNVSTELAQLAVDARERAISLARPNRWLLAGSIVLGLLASMLLIGTFYFSYLRYQDLAASSLADLAQGVDAVVNEILLLAGALYFLMTLDVRLKRHRVLEALHELRSLAHIIDMHQLTKDPQQLCTGTWIPTTTSPQRTELSRGELERYLDYCSEMLAVVSKIAALHVQYLKDDQVLAAVDEIEGVSLGLSQKIWQKIAVLHRLQDLRPSAGTFPDFAGAQANSLEQRN